GDPQPVVREDAAAPGALRLPVLLRVAPGLHRLLVAPEGQRKDPARVRQALEELDRDEAVDAIEQRPKVGGDAEIGVAAALRRLDLEDDRDHDALPAACGAEASVRKMRSSRRMKRRSFAKA